MQLAVSTYSLQRHRREQGATVEQCLDWLAAIGVTGVELVGLGEEPIHDPLRRARALAGHCERLGLRVVGYCTGGELLRAGDEQRTEVDRIKGQIDVAAELGAPSMRHDVTRGPGQDSGQSFDDVLQTLTPAVRELTEHGESRGVITTLENHGFYMQTAERVRALIEAVDHPNFRLTLDMGNFLCLDQDPVEAVRALAPYAVMAHAKDFHVRAIERVPADAPAVAGYGELKAGWLRTPTRLALRGTIVGHGSIDIPAQLAALQQAGYDGPMSLEFEGPEDPRDAVRLGLAYLKSQLG